MPEASLAPRHARRKPPRLRPSPTQACIVSLAGLAYRAAATFEPTRMSSDAAAATDEIRLAPHHDTARLAKVFARHGRIHIPHLLREEDAQRIHDALTTRTPWDLTIIHKDLVYDLTPEQLAQMSPEKLKALDDEVMEFARRQYEGR